MKPIEIVVAILFFGSLGAFIWFWSSLISDICGDTFSTKKPSDHSSDDRSGE